MQHQGNAHALRSCTTGGEQMTGWLEMPEISKRASIMVQFCEANFPRKLSAPAALLQSFATRGNRGKSGLICLSCKFCKPRQMVCSSPRWSNDCNQKSGTQIILGGKYVHHQERTSRSAAWHLLEEMNLQTNILQKEN